MASIDPEKIEQQLDPQQRVASSSPVYDDEISAAAEKHRDDNYELYKVARDLEATPQEIKKVLRKIDRRVIPILFITYMLQYLDKNSINFASVYGLKQGTHLVGQDYSWLGLSSHPL